MKLKELVVREDFRRTSRTVIYSWLFLIAVILFGVRVDQWVVDRRADARAAAKADDRSASELLQPRERQNLAGPALLERLRKGNLVFFARHFATQRQGIQDDTRQLEHPTMKLADFRDCAWQRPLSDEGRLRAENVRMAWQKLGIPIGEVVSSPYCRCVETARLLTGRAPELSLDLLFRAGSLSAAEHVRKLLPILTAPVAPQAGGNTLIVGHRAKMDALNRIEEGDIFIYEPLPDGEFNLVAEVKMEEWVLATEDPQFLGIARLGEKFRRVLSAR